jgi:dethiobiotin synthetase
MITKPPYGLFVTGTDTEVGKTYVASLIAESLVKAGYKVGVYKPISSDCVADGNNVIAEDAVALWEAAGRPLTLEDVCPQRFLKPIAPHLAARDEGKELDPALARSGLSVWQDECDIVVVEGAGGLMSPISDDEFIADLAYDFGYPAVVVGVNCCGAINQTLQTLVTAACFRDGITVGGVVLNDSQSFDGDQSRDTNEREITLRATVPFLGRVFHQAEKFDREIDWMAIAKQTSIEMAK